MRPLFVTLQPLLRRGSTKALALRSLIRVALFAGTPPAGLKVALILTGRVRPRRSSRWAASVGRSVRVSVPAAVVRSLARLISAALRPFLPILDVALALTT